MNQREARRVACILAAKILDRFLSSGMLFDVDEDNANENTRDLQRIEKEIQEIADRLDERGRRTDRIVVTFLDAYKAAGVDS